jgi:quercetin dioxygenase-like cupin family protein
MNNDYRVDRWKAVTPPIANDLRRQMECEGYSVYQWSDRPGSVYEAHDHSEDQSHWIVSGSLELSVEGFGTVLLEPGDRDLMPAGTRHSARVIGDEPVVYLIGTKG